MRGDLPMTKNETAVLAGDVGGTKTRLAVFSSTAGLQSPLAEADFASRDYASLEAVVREFLSGVDAKVDRASFGVAGPVFDRKARITNLPWVLDEERLAEALGLASVRLLNDLEAVATAVPWLGAGDLFTLNKGRAAPNGSMAVVAPGTGLGEAFLIWDGAGYRAYPSEGGHADFAPTNPQEAGLLLYLLKRFEHVSYERVCSGIGLPNIYAYLKDSEGAVSPESGSERLAGAEDPTPLIIAAALDNERPCARCRTALEMFASILGAEAGNLAMKVMGLGGVYIGGGIPPRILPVLRDGAFMGAFKRKGRMSRMMEAVPVHVIMNPTAALLGAASRAIAGREI
jgi:glucokinase